MVLEIIQVERRGVSITRQPFVTSATISWNSGDIQWYTLLIDCSSHRGAHFIHSHICSILNGYRDNSSTRSQRVSITRQPFITTATITLDPGDLEWYTLLIDCSAHRGTHFIHSHICSISNGSRDNSSTMSQRVSITRQPFITSATITWDPGDLQWNSLLIDCSSRRGAHFSYWHICSISNGSRDNSSTSSLGVSITRHQFITSANITWDPGELLWNTLLIGCSSHRGAHFVHSHICSISNGSRDNSNTRSQRVSISRQPFITTATITLDPGDLDWYTLLIDCSAHRGTHFIHSHICSISNGSPDNSSTRSQRVSITRQPFITSATITWDPGDLQWNTLLIDCSSRRGAHFRYWHICSISNGSRDNSSTSSQGVSITRQQFITSATITWDSGELLCNTLLIDCSSHWGAHFSHWHICSISNGSRDNSSRRSQGVSITRQPFVTSATISWNSGDIQWYTLLIDCSSHRGAHFIHSHNCSILNGYRDNSSTRSQRVSITRQPFITTATITLDPGDLEWYTLLIDCSAHRGTHFIHSHICSISNGSRDNSSTMSQRVSITRQPFITSATTTWDPGDLQWNSLLIDCSSRRGAHFRYWHICSISNGSRDNSSTSSLGVSITRHQFITSANITWDPGELLWNTLLIGCSSHRGAHFVHSHICSISNGSRDNSSTGSRGVSITRQPFITSATISWDPGELQWNTLLIDCSSHRGAHFSYWHICSISNGSRDNSSTSSQRVSITRQPFITSATITWDPGDLQWNTLLIDCSSRRGAHFSYWHICSISNGSRDNSSTGSRGVSITRQPFITSATITWVPGKLQWNTLLIDCSSHRGAHFIHSDFCSISNGSRDNSNTRSQRVSITRQPFITTATITLDPGD